jgi:hypothetical protein
MHSSGAYSAMKRISNFSFYRIVGTLVVVAIMSAGQMSFAEQFDAPKKARRVSNRQIPIVQDLPASSEAYEEPQLDEEFYEDDSVVVQASCKNCSSSTAHNQTMHAEDYTSEEIYEASAPHTFSDPLSSDCDGGACFQSSCGSQGTCCINPCSPFALLSQRLYIRAESASFWGSGQVLPTLVTSNGNALFGGREIGTASVPGFRSDVGIWLDDCQSRAVVVRMFYGGDNDLGLITDSNAFPNLELPFLSVATNPATQSQALVAVPGQLSGNVNANLSSNVYGGDLLFRRMLARDNLGRWDWLMGYQTARLSESLSLQSTRETIPAGTTNSVTDSFDVKNQFHGATFGFSGDVRDGCWYFGGMFKLGLGNMDRSVSIRGSQTTTVAGVPNTTASGLHASSRTNSGNYSFDTFVVSPELNLTAGYKLTPKLDFTVGYNLLRLPKVTRVTDALDPRLAVDDAAVPTQMNPAFVFSESNFTLHSLNLGLQWNY